MSLKDKFAAQFALQSEAPDLLLKKICELRNTIAKANENATKNGKAIDFYTSVLNTMKYAWGYMEDVNFVFTRNKQLESQVEYLQSTVEHLQNKLLKFEVIAQLKVSGDFDEVVQSVTDYLNHQTTANNE
jgi:hypothetical protein